MSSYLSIQTEVLRNLIDTPTAVQTGVPNYINRAMKTLQGFHNFKVMESEFDFVTVLGERTGNPSVPTNFKDLRDDPYLVWEDGTTIELVFAANRTVLRRLFDDEDEGQPQVLYDPEGDNETDIQRIFEVWPLPDGNSDYTDGEYRIVIPYWKYVTALVNDADTNWFTTNAEEYLIRKATAEGFATDWDENRLAVWEQRAAISQRDAINFDKNYRISGVRELVPHWRGARQPFVRR